MDELLEGVIHGQKGELEKHKEEFVNLQVTAGEGVKCALRRTFINDAL